jgi:hypothetical protein
MPQINPSRFLDLQATVDDDDDYDDDNDDDDESNEEEDLGAYNPCHQRMTANPQFKSPSYVQMWKNLKTPASKLQRYPIITMMNSCGRSKK